MAACPLAQVKVLQFHPVQPWLAFADGNQTVTIWDWSSQQVAPWITSRLSCVTVICIYCPSSPSAHCETCRWCGRSGWGLQMTPQCRTPCCKNWLNDNRGTTAVQSQYGVVALPHSFAKVLFGNWKLSQPRSLTMGTCAVARRLVQRAQHQVSCMPSCSWTRKLRSGSWHCSTRTSSGPTRLPDCPTWVREDLGCALDLPACAEPAVLPF